MKELFTNVLNNHSYVNTCYIDANNSVLVMVQIISLDTLFDVMPYLSVKNYI